MMIPLFYDSSLLSHGIKLPVNWDYTHCPHALIIGATGSGKTYAVILILGRIALHIPHAQITVCDFKADDFKFLQGCLRYYEHTACKEGLDSFYKAFQDRQQGVDNSRTFRLLAFDEWASYLNSLDKKQSELEKVKLATLLMLGRSFNMHVLVSQQRADAFHFNSARDNFNVVMAFGNISKESAAMFGFDREEMRPITNIGQGHILTNSTLQAIQVPTVKNMDKLHAAIRQIVDN